MEEIKTYLFSGFLDAGKTTYMLDAIYHGFFHKHGRTLILSFEQGEVVCDAAKLREYNTDIAYYEAEGSEDITAFCLSSIKKYTPDRIYVEDNAMIEGLTSFFPPCMTIAAKTTMIDGTTLPLYFNNMRQILQNIVKGSVLVLFNRVRDQETLKPYGSAFRVMERNAAYLWESPMGYHEKAFGNILTFDFSASHIALRDEDFLSFFLDTSDRPDQYDGKVVEFTVQVRGLQTESFRAGRTVMTCCLADLQFLSFECLKQDVPGDDALSDGSWIRLTAGCSIGSDEYGRKILLLRPVSISPAAVPEKQILTP